MEPYRIIGVDLAKASTGVSIVEVEKYNLKVIDVFSIKSDKWGNFNKLYFYAKDFLNKELKKIFDQQKCKFSVAVEFNIFSSYSSELGFYLTQELLHLCYKENIDVVGYSPMFLKKFVKFFVTDGKKYPSSLEKEHIRDIYEKYVYPLNKNILPESNRIKDSDSMDALFLSILGSILQNVIMGEEYSLRKSQMSLKNILNHEFEELFLIHDNYYMSKYLEKINNFKFNNFKINETGVNFGKQFKSFIGDTRKKDHLTLRSKFFFPFNLLAILTNKMRVFRTERPEEFYDFWTKYLGSRTSYLKKRIPLEKEFVCLFNKKGDFFLRCVEE